jgi:hypothetical protein
MKRSHVITHFAHVRLNMADQLLCRHPEHTTKPSNDDKHAAYMVQNKNPFVKTSHTTTGS